MQALGIDTILFIVAIALVVLGFFRILKRYVIRFLGSDRVVKESRLLVLRIEVAVWVVFALFSLIELLSDSLLTTTVTLGVIALVGLNFWRDFFPGLLFRIENKFEVNDAVRFEKELGNIHKLGITHIQIKTENEEMIFLPYRKLAKGTFVKRQTKGKLLSTKLVFNIGTLNEDMIVEKFNQWIFQCPWAVPESKNAISIQPGGIAHLTVYATDTESLGKVERFLKSRLNSLQ